MQPEATTNVAREAWKDSMRSWEVGCRTVDLSCPGDPGSGEKRRWLSSFCWKGGGGAENVFYITLAETRKETVSVARSHGWSLEGVPMLEMSAVEKFLRPGGADECVYPSEVELNDVSRLLAGGNPEGTSRADGVRLAFRIPAAGGDTVAISAADSDVLKQAFAKLNSTVLLLDDRIYGASSSDPHILSLSHGVSEMEQIFSRLRRFASENSRR